VTARDEALAALAAHKAAIDQAEQHLADLKAQTVDHVVACRQLGPNKRPLVTWQEIADELGRQKTHVSAEYSKLIEEVRTVRVKPTSEETP